MHDDRERLVMTPGPTAVPPDVREAMSSPARNPDVEGAFTDDYRRLLDKLGTVYGTDDDLLVLGGEGILGLEAAVASLVSPGDDVLCLANGLYGAGFADFVELHGGEPTVHESGHRSGFDADAVTAAVEDGDYAVATMVHCETPTGLLNDLEAVLATLRDHGVLTVVDAVSSLGGTPVPTEHIDVCLGASQKAFSSPPGLTTASVSDRAWAAVEATDQDTFYTSFAPWKDVELPEGEPVLLPYTHLVSNLNALEASLDRIIEEGVEAVFDRHERAAARCRERGDEGGLSTFPDEGWSSPTVTAFEVEADAGEVTARTAEEHGVVLSTGLGDHADDIVRVGHMGYSAEVEAVDRAMDALLAVLD